MVRTPLPVLMVWLVVLALVSWDRLTSWVPTVILFRPPGALTVKVLLLRELFSATDS